MRPSRSALSLGLFVAALGAGGCGRSEPPSPAQSGASPSIAPLPPSIQASAVPAPAVGDAGARASASAGARAGAGAGTGASADAGSPAVDPGTLPQTRDRPGSDSAAFNARVASLWSAIVDDDPAKALPFFFPASAYDQVKDIPQPSGDWKHRLWKNYARDIHALHARVSGGGKGGDEKAEFVSFDVPDDRAKWVDPGHEVNKIGYWRVFGTKLRYRAGGEERAIDVTSLISWRGEWYVVHLTGFK